MYRQIGFVILAIAAIFIIMAAVGLFNSNIDSRVALLIALGVAGTALVPIGLSNIRGADVPKSH
jgi:hypothetical protein